MTAQHTPGPWTARPEDNYRRAEVTWNERGDPIAEVFGPSRDQRQANARLIAAAPDLLKALRAVMGGQIGGQPDMDAERFRLARAAIAKAEGREP